MIHSSDVTESSEDLGEVLGEYNPKTAAQLKKIEMKLNKLTQNPLTHTDKELLRGIYKTPRCNVFKNSGSEESYDEPYISFNDKIEKGFVAYDEL